MAITLTARRSRGDMFTAEDDIEVVFDYSDASDLFISNQQSVFY